MMWLSADDWCACAARARRLADVASRQSEALELATFAEECDIAAAMVVLGHLPTVEAPPSFHLTPTLRLVAGASDHARNTEPLLLATG